MSVLPRIALFLQYVLPRNSRNTQNLLVVYSPTDCTLLAVCSPTEFTEYTEPSCCIFSHGIHGTHRTFLLYVLPRIAQIFTDAAFKGVHLSVSICEICGRILSATSSVNSVNSVGEYLGRVISVGVLPVNLLLAMLAQIGVALREVVVAEPPATVGRQR